MKILQRIYLVLIIILVPLTSFSQSKEELRKRVSNNKSAINTASKILEETQQSRSSSINELYIIQKRIELRNDLIENLNNQITNLDRNIANTQGNISELQSELKKLKEDYAKIIYFAFKNHKSLDRLMFILSSRTFNQAYKRYKYLRQYAEFRRNQALEIKVKTEKLKLRVQELKNLRHQKEDILSDKVDEKAKLKREKLTLNSKISNLKSKEKELRQEIARKKKIVEQLEKEIKRIIAEERERTELWKNLSKDQRQLSVAFEKSKGQLPWPITDGIVTRKFGENQHPVLKGVKTYNNGVDITTAKNSKVQCIFPGIARRVVAIPGANLTVIIRHGNYLTVYSNLVDVNVKPGEKVRQGQIIGEVFNNQDKNENILHVEIYKESEKLNPEAWLE